MGAGWQRWWLDDAQMRFERECAIHSARQHVTRGPLVRCVTGDGVECRLRLYTHYPMYYGVINLKGLV